MHNLLAQFVNEQIPIFSVSPLTRSSLYCYSEGAWVRNTRMKSSEV